MKEKILNRLFKDEECLKAFKLLSERLNSSDLQSLLIETFRFRAEKLSARDLMISYGNNRFVKPSHINPKFFAAFDQLAYDLLPENFQAIELPPVCPLGTNSVMAPVNQNNCISTTRNTEVCSDSTNFLALECAVRRRQLLLGSPRSTEIVGLCASHRLTRTQTFSGAASFAHFRIFSMVMAGRDEGGLEFERRSLLEQLYYHLKLAKKLKELGYEFSKIKILFTVYEDSLYDLCQYAINELHREFPQVRFKFSNENSEGEGYYRGLRFNIYFDDNFIVDGGFTDWTATLLANQKERLLISGFGSERFIFCFSNDKDSCYDSVLRKT